MVDPKLVASITFVERFQYHGKEVSQAINRNLYTVFDLLQMKGPVVFGRKVWTNIEDWVNCSRGYCRIKWQTAMRAWELRGKSLGVTDMDICEHTHNNRLSVKISSMILNAYIWQWSPFVDISKDVEILATLYNVSDFTNKPAHPHPRPGGSVGSIIVDGVLLENLNFAERVKRVYNSREMHSFMYKVKGVV